MLLRKQDSKIIGNFPILVNRDSCKKDQSYANKPLNDDSLLEFIFHN